MSALSEGLLDHVACTATRRAPLEDCLNLSMFIREPGEVFLSHSLADRNYLLIGDGASRFLNRFSLVCVPGSFTRDRLLNTPAITLRPDQIVAMGHPRIDVLRRMQQDHAPPEPLPEGRLRVLYAPAHGGHMLRDGAQLSTWPDFAPHLEDLAQQHEVVTRLHPRDRQGDKAILGAELLDCDVLITDVSSAMFEAWALGKPVIFPRWLMQDKVERRYPGSAEAHICAERIGLHPDSPEEMLALLDQIRDQRAAGVPVHGSVLGEDVQEFMRLYLANYDLAPDQPDSVAQICDLLRLQADPEYRAQVAAAAELQRQREEARLRRVQTSATRLPKAAEAKSRASIQLLQQALLDENYTFLAQAMSGLRAMALTGLAADMAVIEVEAALDQGQEARVETLISRLPAPARAYYHARQLLLAGDADAALDMILPALEAKLNRYPAWQIAVAALVQLDEAPEALRLIETLVARFGLRVEIVEDLLELLPAEAAQPLLAKFLKSKGFSPWNQRLYTLRSTLMAEGVEAALPLARRMALQAAEGAPGWAAPATTSGWGGRHGQPLWLLPYEGLPVRPVYHRAQALPRLCRLLQRLDLPFFLSRETLRAALAGTAPAERPDVIELGLRLTPETDLPALVEALAQAAGLLRCQPDPLDEGQIRLRGRDGVTVLIQPHLPAEAPGMVAVRDLGQVQILPFEGPVWREVPGLSAGALPLPADPEAYLAALQEPVEAAPGVLHLGLYRDFIEACGQNNPTRMAALAGRLKRLGDWGPFIHLARMQKAMLLPDLPARMSAARFLIHLGDGVDADFHVDLWYPYVRSVDPAAILVIRSMPLFTHLQATRPDLPTIYVKSGIEAEWVVSNCPDLAGVLYVSNTGNTIHFLRFNHLRHVFLGHGDSEKAASCHKFFRAYDEVWTAGRAHIGRFLNSGMDHASVRFRVVGRPTLRPMIEAARGAPEPGFLYLPTWEGFQAEQEYTSIREAESFIPAVMARTGLGAVVKFHPWVGKRVTALNEVEDRLAALETERPVTVVARTDLAADIMPQSSFLISDISSVVSDYLPTGRPIFLYIPKGGDIRTSTSAVPMEAYCYVFHDQTGLEALVERVVVQGDDWLRQTRLRAADYFVDRDRSLGLAFEAELAEVAREQGKPIPDPVMVPVADHLSDGQSETVVAPRPAALVAALAPRPPFGRQPGVRPLIVGHRGAKAEFVENSMAGFRAVAAMKGLDAVELDVHLTADGELVVLHDPTLERTTTGTGPVSALTLAELRALKLRDLLDPKGRLLAETVPTLQEVLTCLAPSHLDLHIELKNDVLGNVYPGMGQKVLDMVAAFGLRDRAVLTSFTPEVLADLRWMDPQIGLLASINMRSVEMMGGLDRCLSIFDRIPGCILALDHKLLHGMRTLQGDRHDLTRFGIWVVNDRAAALEAGALGLRQITTDRPSQIIEAFLKGK